MEDAIPPRVLAIMRAMDCEMACYKLDPMATSTPTQAQTSTPAERQHSPRFRRLRQISHWLDNAIPVPGTEFRFGLDPILGLIPGAGDGLAAFLSVMIIWESAQLGASRPTLIRMILNVLFETVVGVVPLLGDLVDVAWKANVRNLDLLEQELDKPQFSQQMNRWFLILVLLGLGAILLGLILIPLFLFSTILRALLGG